MSWNVYFFQTPRGEKIVKEFLNSLEPSAFGKVSNLIDVLKTYGPYLKMPYAKQLNRKIHELRAGGKERIRILYSITKSGIYILHAFKKKTQKTPPKEIEIAEKRLRRLTGI